ncbi:MAG: hypothetical protein PHQ12_10445 [Chthoniobacteraceae bacterium]|nr:hypothetical protein [Chthoniobacteraceae bacterium]
MKSLPLVLILAVFTLSACASHRCCGGTGTGCGSGGSSHVCCGPKVVKTPAKTR